MSVRPLAQTTDDIVLFQFSFSASHVKENAETVIVGVA